MQPSNWIISPKIRGEHKKKHHLEKLNMVHLKMAPWKSRDSELGNHHAFLGVPWLKIGEGMAKMVFQDESVFFRSEPNNAKFHKTQLLPYGSNHRTSDDD